MQQNIINRKMGKIYEPKGRAREYSPLAFNFYKGCTHGCKYCYVAPMFNRFDSNYNHNECQCTLNVAELEDSAKAYQGCGKQILLSFTGDPYCGVEAEKTTKVLEILKKYGHKVAILTKGGRRCLQDLDLFKSFGPNIKVGTTLTFDNDTDSREWEPNAASPEERIETLKTLSENGIKTWVSFEPVIIPGQTLNLLSKIAEFIDHVKIGKLNNYKGIDKKINWREFAESAIGICKENNVPFYVKDDLRISAGNLQLSAEESDKDYLNL